MTLPPRRAVLVLAVLLHGAARTVAAGVARASGPGVIVRADPRFDELVPRDAALEKVVDGFAWVEGPVWRRDGALLFSDVPSNSVFIWRAGPGGIHVFAPDGTLLGSIETGVATSNCAWGGDGSTLFVTAGPAVFRIRLATKGPGF